jgi:hypothetical protein
MESPLKMRCSDYQPLNILLLPIDILLIIINYFMEDKDIATLYSLLLTCGAIAKLIPSRKKFEMKINKSAQIRLLGKLSSYPNDLGRILIDMIKKEKALIAGGYILQCITEDTFEDSDIDIFISCDRTKGNHECLNDIRNMITSTFKLDCPTSPFYNIAVQDDSNYGILKNIRHILSMNMMSLKIQFIIVWSHMLTTTIVKIPTRVLGLYRSQYQHTHTPLSLEEFIKNDFDISLCKCWFDGENIYSEDILSQVKRVGIMDSKELNKVVAKVSRKKRYDRMIERLEKYTQRGFSIINITNLTEEINE